MAEAYYDDDHLQPKHRQRPPWGPTIAAQVLLCLTFFFALSFCGHRRVARGPRDLYFLTVRGGSRSEIEQTQLLRQMAAVAGARMVGFVVDLTEYGEKDPLWRNATRHFPSLRIPWYATGSKGSYFHEQVEVYQGQILDLIGLDAGLLQDFTKVEQTNGNRSEQYSGLLSTLAETSGTWRIIFGSLPWVDCTKGATAGKAKPLERLHHIFNKYQVNAYISNKGCNGDYIEHEGISYMRSPGLADEDFSSSIVDSNSKNNRKMHNGYLLHRVFPLDIETYFINSAGHVISQHTMHQWGKQSM